MDVSKKSIAQRKQGASSECFPLTDNSTPFVDYTCNKERRFYSTAVLRALRCLYPLKHVSDCFSIGDEALVV